MGDMRHGQLPTMISLSGMISATGIHGVSLEEVQCSLLLDQAMMTYYQDVDNWAKTLNSQSVLLPPHRWSGATASSCDAPVKNYAHLNGMGGVFH